MPSAEKPDPRIFATRRRFPASSRPRPSTGDLYSVDVVARAAGARAILPDPFGAWTIDDV
jgi:hypothetical protein